MFKHKYSKTYLLKDPRRLQKHQTTKEGYHDSANTAQAFDPTAPPGWLVDDSPPVAAQP